ncbi:MAG: TIGR02186 family protein [Geminicoccaceae bacterium]|nr:TIGR02186 family protein [Geminicoccaceae bacterium]
MARAGHLGFGERRALPAFALLVLALLGPLPARGDTFIADLSDHLIAITTAFIGTSVLLFGVTDEPGVDVAVVVRGPFEEAVVRRKSRVGFVWLNTDEVRFADTPAYYAVAASGPLDQLGLPRELQRHQIGFEHLPIRVADAGGVDGAALGAFRLALLRTKQREDLYPSELGTVRFLGERLFRTTLNFPANVPPGSYAVEVFQLKGGRVVAAQQSALVVTKIGIEAELYDLSRHRPALYAAAAIALALAAGWSAGLIFRK